MSEAPSQLLEMLNDDAVPAAPRGFDGIVCFGDNDWWYHNRGHYDLQMMRALTSFVPVLYVNSIGMRLPSVGEGPMFVRRIARKLCSLGRGYVPIAPGFSVLTPFVVPGGAGMALTERFLPGQVRRAANRLGITRPLVWVACPTAARAVERIGPEDILYQRTDRTEAFSGVDARRIKWFDRCLKEEADLTLFASALLYDHEQQSCPAAAYVDHGVDFDRFDGTSVNEPEPADVAGLPHPRVGFIGSIDDHTFDAGLFREVAARLPDVTFVLVGASSLPPGWCHQSNVVALGQRPYESVAAYMRACDVLIMPWNRSPWINACNPVKLKEYLATGRPVVSTWFHELERYEGLVAIAQDAETFAAAITVALAESDDDAIERRRARVRGETWARRAGAVLDRLAEARIYPVHSQSNPVMSLMEAGCHRASEPPALSLVADTAATDTEPSTTGLDDMHFDTHLERREALCGVDLGGVILLDGGLRPSPLAESTGRSVLDSPIGGSTLLGHWLDRIDALTDGAPDLPVRVVFDGRGPAPHAPATARANLRLHADPLPFRGPAGIIRDVCDQCPLDRHILVIEAARFLTVGLTALLDAHALHGADITLATNPDGQPAGLTLVRRSVLELVPPIGFMDLKEQLLPRAIEAGHEVRVAPVPAPGTLPIRTRRQYATVVRFLRAAPTIPLVRRESTAPRLPDRSAGSERMTSSAEPRHAS